MSSKKTLGASDSNGLSRCECESRNSSGNVQASANKEIRFAKFVDGKNIQSVKQSTLGSQTSAKSPVPDSNSQIRSTIAIGQLISASRPSPGSRLIASEIRQLSKSIQEDSQCLRKEIANLSLNMANAFKSVFEEAREQRNMALAFNRRPSFAQNRRFPIYAQRRIQRATAIKTGNLLSKRIDSSTNTPIDIESSSSTATPISSLASTPTDYGSNTAQEQASSKTLISPTSMKSFKSLLKNAYMPDNSSFFSREADSDSTATTPSSSP